MFVKGGYLEVQTHAITVLADMAIRAKDLDGRAALEAKKAAEDAMAQRTSREEIAAPRSLSNAVAQLEAIRKLRHRARPVGPGGVRGHGRRPVADRRAPP